MSSYDRIYLYLIAICYVSEHNLLYIYELYALLSALSLSALSEQIQILLPPVPVPHNKQSKLWQNFKPKFQFNFKFQL